MKVYHVTYDQAITATLEDAIAEALYSMGATPNTRPAVLKRQDKYIVEIARPTTRGLRIARRTITEVELNSKNTKHPKIDYDFIDITAYLDDCTNNCDDY